MPTLKLGGLAPQLQAAPETPRLLPGGLALRLLDNDEPDDLDLMPDLVPLVDPNDVEGSDSGMSFDAVDLSDDGDEGTATASDDALVADPDAVAPAEKKPILGQWWFWAAVGVVVIGGGSAVAATSSPEIVLPEGSLGTMDRR